jgi:alpha-tubulin suppressor-like RCC1 family protein
MAGTTVDDEHFPTAQKLASLHSHKVVQAASAHSAVFALAESGRVLAWGRCASGLLGMTSRVPVFSPKTLSFLTSGPSPRRVAVRFLAAGVHHCAAISDGTLQLLHKRLGKKQARCGFSEAVRKDAAFMKCSISRPVKLWVKLAERT